VEDVEGFIDGTCVPAKKGGTASANAVLEGRPRSWQSQTAMVFHSLLLLHLDNDTASFSRTELSMLLSWSSYRLD
jgi:hypothetical protein